MLEINPKKIQKNLKWKRKYNFEHLVKDMVESELNNLKFSSFNEK